MDEYVEQLHNGLEQLSLPFTKDIEIKLLEYLALLSKWNNAYNLTAIKDIQTMISHHLLDSLAIHKYVVGQHIIDVGTGAGLPGIPLALTHPKKEFVLLDSNGKKIRFLQQVLYELDINNVRLDHSRVESYHPENCFDTIISRAFASLADMLAKTSHLCCPRGQFLAMKGQVSLDELGQLEDGYTITEIHQLKVPDLDAERHLIVIEESHSG